MTADPTAASPDPSSPAARHAAAHAAWGDDEPEPRAWSSGPWSIELRGDELADIAFEGAPVVRGVKAVIRDRDWGTVASQAVSVSTSPDTLAVELRFAGLGGDFSGMLRAEVVDSVLTISTELRALVAFERNRAGLVVLLPADSAGAGLRVVHPDGTADVGALPASIAPHQPAVDIAELEWTRDGLRSAISFAGDVFEMEDQRNWTDASFKIYSTPLSLPFPVALAAGTVVRQSLQLRATREAPASPTAAISVVELRPAGRAVPTVGTSAASGPEPTRDAGAAASLPLPMGVLLVELDLAAANWRAALIRAVGEADGAPLDLRLISDDPAAITGAVEELAPLAPVRLGVFSPVSHVTEESGWRALEAAVAASGISAELVGGTRAHFTELNRNHERLSRDIPNLAFSSTPQMHATERAQLVEAIPIQRVTAVDAVRIADGRPVHIGPITLRARFNAVATTPPPAEPADLTTGYGPAHLADATDPRQDAPALAAWTIASAAAFAVTGVASLSYFEESGPRGVLGHPVELAYSWLNELAGHPLLEPVGGLPAGIWMLAAELPDGPVALLANLRSEPASLAVRFGEHTMDVALEPLGTRRVPLGS